MSTNAEQERFRIVTALRVYANALMAPGNFHQTDFAEGLDWLESTFTNEVSLLRSLIPNKEPESIGQGPRMDMMKGGHRFPPPVKPKISSLGSQDLDPHDRDRAVEVVKALLSNRNKQMLKSLTSLLGGSDSTMRLLLKRMAEKLPFFERPTKNGSDVAKINDEVAAKNWLQTMETRPDSYVTKFGDDRAKPQAVTEFGGRVLQEILSNEGLSLTSLHDKVGLKRHACIGILNAFGEAGLICSRSEGARTHKMCILDRAAVEKWLRDNPPSVQNNTTSNGAAVSVSREN